MDRKYLVFMGLGFELVVLVVGFLYVGSFLDARMNWPGFGIAGGAAVALIVWIVHLAVAMKAIDPDSPEKPDQEM